MVPHYHAATYCCHLSSHPTLPQSWFQPIPSQGHHQSTVLPTLLTIHISSHPALQQHWFQPVSSQDHHQSAVPHYHIANSSYLQSLYLNPGFSQLPIKRVSELLNMIVLLNLTVNFTSEPAEEGNSCFIFLLLRIKIL